jgi:hypothetical protein
MRYSGVFPRLGLIVTVAAVAALCSCGNDTCGPCGEGPARTTVEGLLGVLEESFETRSPALYDECLEDGYVFEFASADAESLGLPAWDPTWDKTEDTTAVGSMLRSGALSGITFQALLGSKQRTEVEGDSAVIMQIYPEITATLHTGGSDSVTYLIDHSELEITAVHEAENPSLWVIRRMKESHVDRISHVRDGQGLGASRAVLAVSPMSLGMLKAMFYETYARGRVSRVLETYARCCEERNIDMYDGCLADHYRFVFVPDVAEEIGLPPDQPWWGKTKDVASMSKMFSSAEVTNIRFDYAVVSSDTLVKDDSLIVRMRVEPDIRVPIERPGEEPMTYWVRESFLDFRFIRDPLFPDADLWVMLDTVETVRNPFGKGMETGTAPASEACTLACTFSMIKAMFE